LFIVKGLDRTITSVSTRIDSAEFVLYNFETDADYQISFTGLQLFVLPFTEGSDKFAMGVFSVKFYIIDILSCT
jgi:hypothetical protein